MVKYKTQLDKKTIRALTEYHVRNSARIKKKRMWGYVGATLVLLYSLVNAYGLYLKFEGEPVFLLKASVYILISFMFFFTARNGSRHTLENELKKYFSQTGTTYLEYIISESGIELITSGHTTMYEWGVINRMEADKNYYYFSSNKKHSIIAKESISEKAKQIMDEMMESINKDYLEVSV